ncbi:unnamed protein product [Durusdinium trenchii]|uniref:Uncharacterized protein n=2 Tax=Durusdinium trenchii TaxID=1381693 RepID=A0ABP0JMN7_9DINO
MHRHPPPAELRPKLVQCPVMDDDGRQEGRGSDRIFVVNLAKTYACPFVDNSNYREQVWSGHEIWPWLQKGGLAQKATLRRWRGDCSKPAGSLIGCSFCILLLFLQLVICSLS